MTDTKREAYHTTAFNAAGAAISSFAPISRIHQHLCAFHCYSDDESRQVERVALDSVLLAADLRLELTTFALICGVTCINADKPDARLIGIEYLVSEEIFCSLPEEEKRYWHSHKYEVESGMLLLGTKSLVPEAATDIAEQPAFLELQKTYGKTIHTWTTKRGTDGKEAFTDFPLGPPSLMMSFTEAGQINKSLLKERDERIGVDSGKKREHRATYLSSYEVAPGCDQVSQGYQLELVKH